VYFGGPKTQPEASKESGSDGGGFACQRPEGAAYQGDASESVVEDRRAADEAAGGAVRYDVQAGT
jgi:hypothetical protein